MKNINIEVQPKDIAEMLDDTSQLLAEGNQKVLVSTASSYIADGTLTENVEFWKWINQNYSSANGHMFSSNSAIKEYISRGKGCEEWVYRQLQGKGYEWDWMQAQRHNLQNLFKRYDAGTVSNQPGYDVLEHDYLSGNNQKYQMKAYTSKANPDLHNTDTSITVVTNTEKADIVSQNGYQVEEYKTAGQIKEKTNQRMKQIENGSAAPGYNVANVAGAMAKAGLIGVVTGITAESISQYKNWKQGLISDEEYIYEALRAGGDYGATSAATAGIMIPITAMVTSAGIAAPVTIPITFLVSVSVNKIIAPCFGRGEYKKILGKAKYYQSVESTYNAFIDSAERATQSYLVYIEQIREQTLQHEQMKRKSMQITRQLKHLYDSI